ncbi:MAG: hypothetical protein ACXW2Q_03480 [Thermoanaerobaculia bacterium]
MQIAGRRSQFFVALYILWIAVCGILFVALRGAEDPSRRSDRILSSDAGHLAVAVLRRHGKPAYEAVHVAYARRGEGGAENRWIVLCDRVPHTALKQAIVVELRAVDGRLITIRKP